MPMDATTAKGRAGDSGSGLTDRTAVELAELVRSGQASPAEIVAAHLARIEALDPRLNAFQLVRAEQALAEARALSERPDLHELPLAGVPVAIKDDTALAGTPTRRGTAATSEQAVEADGEPVRRLRAAGAVIVGKTRMPELGLWHFTESLSFGATRNPWDTTRSPGGSTGGGAAAVASGMVPIALASDGLGSIRIPAAWCGLLGVKPGNGVVPTGRSEHWYGLTALGPLATTVADAALLLDVVAGRTDFRGTVVPDRPLRLRVSTRSPAPGVGVERAILDAVRAAGAVLAEAGHAVTDGDPPYQQKLAGAVFQRWFAGVAQDVDELVADPARLERRTRSMAAIGRRLRRVRPVTPRPVEAWKARMAGAFETVDAFLMPTVARQAPPVGAWARTGFGRTMTGGTRWAPFAAAWNMAQLPALSVPAGLDGDGLPLAVQLVGPAGSEATLLALAAQLEQLLPWPRHAPDPD
jgi:amidase